MRCVSQKAYVCDIVTTRKNDSFVACPFYHGVSIAKTYHLLKWNPNCKAKIDFNERVRVKGGNKISAFTVLEKD